MKVQLFSRPGPFSCAEVCSRLTLLLWLGIAAGGARATEYVVDPQAPGAADANTGTEAKPFQTVQRAADVARAGDTVLVMAGRYDERVKIRTSGLEGRLITFRSVPLRAASVGGFDLNANFIRLDGFEITSDPPAIAIQLGGSSCEILHNYIHHMRIGIAGTVGTPAGNGGTRDYSDVSHNHLAYNKVYHSEYGFLLGGEDWLVENNEVSRLFMYSPGNRFDDCDYSRFFGKRCLQRYNYYHGSTASEIRVAHVDCLQTFSVNGEIAQDLLFEYNTCFDFHQLCMVESAPHPGSVRGWTLRGNIVSAGSPHLSGGWGPDIIQTPEVTIENNTISTVRWAAIGLRGKESIHGLIRNNILCDAERAIVDGDNDFSPSEPAIDHNLTFKTSPAPGQNNLNGLDPLFVNPTQRNFRIQRGSPAVGAGRGGVTIGALEYPNVYFVDPQHPGAADEPPWGYPAVPLASLRQACVVAQPGETILLRGGVYREVFRPENDGVILRAMAGETVTLSGADLVENWKRRPDGTWEAPLSSKPKKLLRDGRRWRRFTYYPWLKALVVKGGDPRLHVFENVVRRRGIDLAGKRKVRIEGVRVANTL